MPALNQLLLLFLALVTVPERQRRPRRRRPEEPGHRCPPAGTALLSYLEHNGVHLAVADVLGFLLFTLGTLLICVALWPSRAVPRRLPACLAVATLAQFAPVTDRLLDVVQTAVMAGFVAVAWFVGRPVGDPDTPDAAA